MAEEQVPPVPVVVPKLERLISDLIEKFVPIDKAHLENYAVSANSDIPSAPLVPDHPPCSFRIMVSFSTAGVLSVVIRAKANTHVLKLFEGNSLLPDCLYIADISVHLGDEISLRYSVDTVIRVLRIQEISRGV